MESDLVYYACVLFELLDYFLCGDVPDVHKAVIAWSNVLGNRRKLTISNPILMFLKLSLQSPINSRPYLNILIITPRNQQIPITRIPNTPDLRIMSFSYRYLFCLVLILPKFDSTICRCWCDNGTIWMEFQILYICFMAFVFSTALVLIADVPDQECGVQACWCHESTFGV